MGTKNITLAIDEDLLQKARVLAAMKRTSVNEMVRDFLAEAVGSVSQGARKAEWTAFFEQVDARVTAAQKALPGGLPTRDELYEEAMRERGLL